MYAHMYMYRAAARAAAPADAVHHVAHALVLVRAGRSRPFHIHTYTCLAPRLH